MVVQDADVHGAGMQVDAAVKFVLCVVEAHEVSSSSSLLFPTPSIPRWYAEEGASISIMGLHLTASSVRSCVAPASGSR
jgi:hypothetical protein